MRLMSMIMLMIILILLTSCTELLFLASGAGVVASQNVYSKAYNSLDMITIATTEKDLKRHVFDKLKKGEKDAK